MTPSPVSVVVLTCPYLRRRVAELWSGLTPIVAANLYLRSNGSWAESTIERKARNLATFFRYLEDQGWSFWDPEVRLGGHRIALFRNALVARCHGSAGGEEGRVDGGLSFRYAREVLHAVFALCDYWCQPGEPPLGATVMRDAAGGNPHRTHLVRVLPDEFRVMIPPEERHQTPDVLLPADVERIWAFVGPETQPKPPADVVRHPYGPPAGWSEARRRRWQRLRDRHAVRLAEHGRRRMLWALMITSGMRRGELPLLAERDVRLFDGELWVNLQVRREHRDLGRAKTGSRQIYVGFEPRMRAAWEAWASCRMTLVARWMARTGRRDHGMFLVRADGSPLTRGGVVTFCRRLSRALGPFGDEGLGDGGFDLHAHACRHTIAALLDEWGVAPEVKRRHLGHVRQTTTDKYGKAFRERTVRLFDAFAAGVLATSDQAAGPSSADLGPEAGR